MYYSSWTCPKKLQVFSYLLQVKVMLTAHSNIPWWVNLNFYFLISIICWQNISSPSSQSKPQIYMCCLLSLVGSIWHIHLSPLCVLEQNLIPESTLTWLFWGSSFIIESRHGEPHHYCSGDIEAKHGERRGDGKTREAGIWDKQNDKVGRGEWGSVSEGC